ncbi:Na/Pi cotransporter family protein [Acidaminobacter hydrogenoformans]|uniref:Phosphate:Na+ symporter n=1 Tax=Acidaminobacter hydrogenoformans DSM 2784 TaxID=1120920 RepID=A0A1G5RXM2_9FIRM|nr:Na/Pi cotransporter family protein [Acidaminobacter hydrogenoformans]SCZ78862.1 phosphate:Na+ symporter [Acidaminobacter hydrogenoformans DSM 2784]
MAFTIGVGVLGGLGLFLYGMSMMGTALQKVAGKKMEKIIELLTKNRLIAVIVGMFVTAIIQSSSLTTVMVVGFVNAGIMKLTQAVGIIMGANIGTTITGQLVSLNLENWAPLAIGIGVFVWFTAKDDKKKNIAEIFIGFGILFLGMEALKDALKPLREIQAFADMMVSFGSVPVLGVLAGFLLTLMVQSSSASMGILIALASQGLIPLASAMPILYGENIGTCTTALISSVGASRNAKRAAIIHLVFNLIGTLLFIVVLTKPIAYVVTQLDPNDVGRQIANAHTMFNLINVAVQFPFAMFLIKIAMKIIPDTGAAERETVTKYLDERILETPSIALRNTIREQLHMANVSYKALSNAMDGFLENDLGKIKETFVLEKEINKLEKAITEYLVKLSNRKLSNYDRKVVDGLFNNINDIERIGDHADNIAELVTDALEKGLPFSEESKKELQNLYEQSALAFSKAMEAIVTGNRETIQQVFDIENDVDKLEKICRRGHIDRLNKNDCNPESGIIFLDVVSNLERVSDLSANLAKVVQDTLTA